MTIKDPTGLQPFGPSARRRVLREARDRGELSYDQLDRLLIDATASIQRMSALIRSLKDVRIVDSTDPDDPLLAPIDVGTGKKVRSDQDDFDAYADQVRRVPRLSRAQEQILARRLEYHYEVLRREVDKLNVSDELREQLLRASQCSALSSKLDDVARSGRAGGFAETLPCVAKRGRGRRSQAQCSCHEYNRLREYMTERNLYLVVNMAITYRTYGLPLMDLVQEGNASLIRAVEKFDWRKNVRFQTYAAFWIRQAIERLITANRGMVRVPNYIQQKMRRLRRQGKLPRDHREMDVNDVSRKFDTNTRTAVRLIETDRNCYSLDAVARDDEEGSFGARIPAEEEEEAITKSEKALLGERLADVMSSNLTGQERDIIALRFGLGGETPQTLDEIGARMRLSRERIRQMQMKALDKLSKPHLMAHLRDFL